MLEDGPHRSAPLTQPESPADQGTQTTRHEAAPSRPPAWAAPLLAVLVLALHVGELGAPFPDGPHGNCGGMFGIIARNGLALGLEARGVPLLNPVPPASVEQALFYTHHPPGLPWLTTLAQAVGGPLGATFETTARLVALLLGFLAALLMLRIGTATLGPAAGVGAALLMVALPAGRDHGALVNYETIAIPALLWLHASLALRRGPAFLAGLAAALADWIALLPLLTDGWRAGRGRWLRAAAGAAVGVVGFSLLYRSMSPTAAGANLGQALGASFLAAGFDAGTWAEAIAVHLVGLFHFGFAIPVLAVIVCLYERLIPALRRLERPLATLVTLVLAGTLNITLFAQHATGHFHFSLLLLPATAWGWMVVFSRAPGEAGTGNGRRPLFLALVLIAVSFIPLGFGNAQDAPIRGRAETELAERFAAVTDDGTIYVRPEGASFVFLHAAERQVVAFPSADRDEAIRRAARQREDFGAAGLPARVVLVPGAATPDWLADATPVREADGFRFYEL